MQFETIASAWHQPPHYVFEVKGDREGDHKLNTHPRETIGDLVSGIAEQTYWCWKTSRKSTRPRLVQVAPE